VRRGRTHRRKNGDAWRATAEYFVLHQSGLRVPRREQHAGNHGGHEHRPGRTPGLVGHLRLRPLHRWWLGAVCGGEVAGLGQALANLLAPDQLLALGALGERLHGDGGQHVLRGPQM
jgi:hypothetical protein